MASPNTGTKRVFASSSNDKENNQSHKLIKWNPENKPPPEFPAAKFKWRGNPEETYSDWTIEIVCNSEKEETETYHAHKFVLGYGPRSSGYFAKLFQHGHALKESESKKSRIELEPIAAQAFPLMLDFIYSPENTLFVDTPSATALHFLGEYFEIHALRWYVMKYCQKDMTMENVMTYHEHASILSDKAVLDLVAEFLAKNISKVYPESTILEQLQLSVFVEMVKALPSGIVSSQRNSQRLSRLVAAKMTTIHKESTHNIKDVYPDFQTITHASKMPTVHPSVALQLCQLEDQFQQRVGNAHEVTSLHKRCIAALSEINSRYFLENTDDKDEERLLQQKPQVLVNLIHQLVASRKDTRDKVDDLQQRLHEATEELEETEGERDYAEQAQEEAEAEVASAEQETEEAQKELVAVKEELRTLRVFIKRLRPLPQNEEKENLTLPDVICKHNPQLANLSATQLQDSEFPIFYYDHTADVDDDEEEGDAEEDPAHAARRVAIPAPLSPHGILALQAVLLDRYQRAFKMLTGQLQALLCPKSYET
ncbi:nervous system development [Seminavis robusta]|uniref:Nervous system development n=1 Tax=Seminavis robusta TaxID=568900 RepID=A0A9N8DMV0_9STRA|nr:nervous system development [Seminavis robusta]|eukprot:Sro248_g098300.1 nervous system development (540) ;mRNA; f:24284-25903